MLSSLYQSCGGGSGLEIHIMTSPLPSRAADPNSIYVIQAKFDLDPISELSVSLCDRDPDPDIEIFAKFYRYTDI